MLFWIQISRPFHVKALAAEDGFSWRWLNLGVQLDEELKGGGEGVAS